MRDREVTFDGKNLSFYIDNVQIVNGEMPDSYEINGKYTIDNESLTRLVSALKKDVYGVVKQKIFSSSYLGCKSGESLRQCNGESLRQCNGESLRQCNGESLRQCNGGSLRQFLRRGLYR